MPDRTSISCSGEEGVALSLAAKGFSGAPLSGDLLPVGEAGAAVRCPSSTNNASSCFGDSSRASTDSSWAGSVSSARSGMVTVGLPDNTSNSSSAISCLTGFSSGPEEETFAVTAGTGPESGVDVTTASEAGAVPLLALPDNTRSSSSSLFLFADGGEDRAMGEYGEYGPASGDFEADPLRGEVLGPLPAEVGENAETGRAVGTGASFVFTSSCPMSAANDVTNV
jgi:hypothetical protein